MHARAWRVSGQNGCVPGQRVEVVLPAVERRAEAEAVLQVQGLGGCRPVHDVKVAHFISVDGPEKHRVKQFTRRYHETFQYVSHIIAWRLHG